VTDTLLGMCPVEYQVRQWLELYVGNWNALTRAIYEIGCFLALTAASVMKSCFICGFIGNVLFLDGSLTSSVGCFTPFDILCTYITYD